jgi:hypothetical protein
MTTAFRQEVVYDDLSQTDICVIKFDIQVTCLISTDYLEAIAPQYRNTDVANAASVMELIRTDLLRPRKDLSFVVNGQELIPQRTENMRGTVDAKNGPQPQRCDIVQMTSSCFVLTYHVVAHYWERYDLDGSASVDLNENLPSSMIMYNRWTESVDIDETDMTRRTRDGKFMIRSNNDAGYMADQLRSQLAVIGVPEGFLRESRTYTQAPDGLGLMYRIVDREAFKMPPSPAFTARGEYEEVASSLGAIRHGIATVELRGSKTTPQHRLVEVALSVVGAKLGINGATVSVQNGKVRFNYLEHSSLKVNMYENVVKYSARAMLTGKREQFRGLPVTGSLVVTPGSDYNLPGSTSGDAGTYVPPYTDRGTASILLQAAAYRDPDSAGIPELTGTVNSTASNPKTPQGSVRMNMPGVLPGEGGRIREN